MRNCCRWLKKEAQTGEKQMAAGIMASNFKYDTLMLNVALIFLGKIGETLEMGKQFITQEQMTERLDQCYFMAIHGVPGSKSCDILATEYLDRYGDSIAAAKKIYG